MKFTLKKPCKHCPFRSDITPYLSPGRIEGIIHGMEYKDETFPCHQTTRVRQGKKVNPKNYTHCAGALIYLEKNKTIMQNWILRFARTYLYKPEELDMDVPVIELKQAVKPDKS